MRKLFTLITALCALTACSSLEEENFVAGTGKTAKVSFNVGGEITAVYENLTRAASSYYYEICIDEKTSETSVTPYLHGTFTSLDNVNAELLVGKTYLVSCQVSMGETASATGAFAQVSNSTAVSYDSNRGFTHYSCDSYQLKDVYYGETTVEIASAVGTSISIDALYCDFGIKFNVTKPLSGTLTVSSTDPAFSYSYSSDGTTTFPTEALRYTMKHPWATDEEVNLTIKYSADNTTKEVTITPKRNKAAKLNINLNPATASLSFSCTLEEIDLSVEDEFDISRDDEETGIPYVTFRADAAQTLTLSKAVESLEYSVDGGEWAELSTNTVTFGGENGDLQLRGKSSIGTGKSMYAGEHSSISFGNNTKVQCSGDIRTLVDYENFNIVDCNNARFTCLFMDCQQLTTAPELPATTLASGCYKLMFSGCKALTTAPELPATTLASECYSNMFYDCWSLTTAPELPATTLASECYLWMFSGCRALTTAPELPATTLASDCYSYMFSGCGALTTAPELLATTLATRCYKLMFDGCKNLNYVKMMAEAYDVKEFGTLWAWNEAAPTGTFVKNVNAAWNESEVIPSGWTVLTANQ